MKQAISNLKDYTELAWASYFYFDLLKDSNNIPRKIYELDKQGNKIKDESYPRGYREIELTLEHIVSKEYQGQEVLVNLEKGDDFVTQIKNRNKEAFNFDKLNGDFSKIQAQNFTKRYRIYFHQPNTTSGFSATLFYDTQEDKFVVGFRGTETDINKIGEILTDLTQDLSLSLSLNPQSSALLIFLIEVSRFVKIYNKKTIFTGHSLGGYLAQVALIYCDKKYKDKLAFSPSEVYTFNAPSIYGWNFPSPIINPNMIKIFQEIFDKRSVDISNKLTHIFDYGGVEVIASAQYGTSNRLPIYTGENSHSIIPTTQTLYLYSYLLELPHNEAKIKDKDLEQTLFYLNNFMEAVYKAFNPLSMDINEYNQKLKTNAKTRQRSSYQKLERIDFLSLFIEQR